MYACFSVALNLLKYDNGNFVVFDNLISGLYVIREIDNSYIPSIFNYCNFYMNSLKVSDLFDFFIQSTFILLGKTDVNSITQKPYIYVYNFQRFVMRSNV